ncbi:hypothetical protein PtB15_12B380 [Puccinia triticina]|nr:hypothetical protein PtB15_12B380 [Puccinia triticina]
MTNEHLSVLSKLTLVHNPSNELPVQSGFIVALLFTGPRETWWEGKWSMEQLQNLVPSKSPHELINEIRSSFSNDDITLIGYREGNETEVRVTIGYSTSGAFTIPLARLNPASESSLTSTQQPFLNLLKITCEAYQQLNSRKHQKHIEQAQSGSWVDQDANQIMTQSSSSQITTAPNRTSGLDHMNNTTYISSQRSFTANSAGPGMKARVTATNRFLDSDESD